MSDWPIERPRNWAAWVNRPQTEAELEALREHVRRSRPYGDDRWMRRTAAKLKLESTLRSHGGKRRRIGTKAGEV